MAGASFFVKDTNGRVAAGTRPADSPCRGIGRLDFQGVDAGTLEVAGNPAAGTVELFVAACRRELNYQLTVADMAEATARLWRQTNALLRMTASTNLALDPGAVLDRIIGQLSRSTNFQGGAAAIRTPEQAEYRVYRGGSESLLCGVPLEYLESLEEAVRLITDHDVDREVKFDCTAVLGAGALDHGPVAVARLETDKECYGFLLAPAPSVDKITSEDLKVFGAAAQILSVAIENGHTLSRERESTRLQVENELLNAQTRDMEEILHVVAHDLRSPMTAMYGFMHLALDQLEDLTASLARERKRELAERAENIVKPLQEGAGSIEKLNRMVQRLLDFSRVARLEYKFEDIDLRALVEEIVRSFSYQLGTKDIDVEIGELPVIHGDRVHLEAMFSNLVDNAIKYMGSSMPRAILIGCVDPQQGIFCIEDTGVGMSPDQVAKAFLPFQRFRSDAAPGEGIGLPYVRKIVERHGGRIWCESREGIGTKFFFTLGRGAGGALPSEPGSDPH